MQLTFNKQLHYRRQYTIHCYAHDYGSSQALQESVVWALNGFRRILMRLGFDDVSEETLADPVQITPAEGREVAGYSAFVMFSVLIPAHQIVRWASAVIDEVELDVRVMLDEAELMANGAPGLPDGWWEDRQLLLGESPLGISPLSSPYLKLLVSAPWESSAPADVESRQQNAGALDGASLTTITDFSAEEEHLSVSAAIGLAEEGGVLAFDMTAGQRMIRAASITTRSFAVAALLTPTPGDGGGGVAYLLAGADVRALRVDGSGVLALTTVSVETTEDSGAIVATSPIPVAWHVDSRGQVRVFARGQEVRLTRSGDGEIESAAFAAQIGCGAGVLDTLDSKLVALALLAPAPDVEDLVQMASWMARAIGEQL